MILKSTIKYLSDLEYLAGEKFQIRVNGDGTCEVVAKVGKLRQRFENTVMLHEWLRAQVKGEDDYR